tara:strand:- start:979 stop:1662 length:684 start_codon:yes stop_codon:yes gene_type:complete
MRLTHIVILLLSVVTSVSAWELENGSTVAGEAASFDFEQKALILIDPITEEAREVSVDQLSLRSRQKLLFSPLYHRSFPDETLWPPEKRKLFQISTAVSIAPLLVGFWLSGLIIAGKGNPVIAMVGFAGSWIVGTILILAYFLLSSRFDNNSTLLMAGIPVAAIFLSMFISAVYGCTTAKGFGVFFFHLFAGFSITLFSLMSSELLFSQETQMEVWEKLVFVPVGLQ